MISSLQQQRPAVEHGQLHWLWDALNGHECCSTERLCNMQMGTSKGLKVGQSVYALGNSQGLSRTLTAGVVSGLNRAVPSPVNTLTYGAIQVHLHTPAPCRVVALSHQKLAHIWEDNK